MILADKIIKLRKQFGWSQEELAEKINVSRQSVSKWEGANSIPDLNKIIKLGEIFGVSTDYLVKDEIESFESISEDVEPGVLKITLEEANNYIDAIIRKSRLISMGVLIVLCSVIPLIFLLALSDGNITTMTSNTAAAIGLVSLFVIISVGVSYFIRGSQYDSKLTTIDKKEFELVYGVRSIFKEKLEAYRRVYNIRVSISVTMFITCVIPLLVVSLMGGSGMMALMMVAVLLLIVGLGVYNIVPVSALFSAYNCLVGEGEYAPENKQATKRMEEIAVIYWPLVTAIYIGWSLWTMQWGITWIVWPVAAIAFAAVVGLLKFFDEGQK
jgi:transcriptional regulator with XRE-family HTH domain